MKLIIIDAYSLLYKAFYGVRPMHAPDNTPTNAIYGFMNMMQKLLREHKPDYFCTAFDYGKVTFRTERYSEYKAGRESMPEDMRAQLPILTELLSCAGVASFSCEGYEADDIIGAVSAKCDAEGIEALIVTGDRDSFQLVSDNTNVLYAKRGVSDTVLVDPEYIRTTYGLEPSQLIDVKALMGDSSDNIPGIAGIGEKTALSLIAKFASLDGVYEHLDENRGKLLERLTLGRDQAYMSRDLARIRREVPCPLELSQARDFSFANEGVLAILRRLSMNNILKQLSEADFTAKKTAEPTEEAADESAFAVVDGLSAADYLGKTVALALEQGAEQSTLSLVGDFGCRVHINVTNDALAEFCESEQINKLTHDLKTIYKALVKKGISPRGFDFDAMVAAYVLNSSDERYSLNDLCERYLNRTLPSTNKSVQQTLFDQLDNKALYEELSAAANAIYELYPTLSAKLRDEGSESLYFDIEHQLIFVLADMELSGFCVDEAALHELDDIYDTQMAELRADILELAGKDESFNINSTKQLGELLFNELKLPVIKKTKTGFSTDIEVLEALSEYHPIITKIIRLRQLAKLSGTYVKGMLKLIDPIDHRIHTTFNQTITTTGRLSSSNPNLQNIPVKTEEGKIIRKVFRSSGADRVLVDADYSQIELRVLAHIAGDKNMIDAFRRGEDIHRRTAGEVFGVPPEEVTGEQRSRAKAVNFGIVYGISDFGLAKNLGIPRKDAKIYIDTYLKKFPGVSGYMSDIVEYARENGYVSTMFGRRRYLPDVRSNNRNIRSFGERTAMNTPIQGSAADIIKIAMVRLVARLNELGGDAKLILQVHDELIVDCREEDAEKIKNLMREEMESCAKLDAPLKVDIASGVNWFDAK